MTGPADMDPGFLAKVDQALADTEREVRELVQAWREHADECHDGDPVCSHAICAFGLHLRPPIVIADIAASAIGLVIRLEARLAELEAGA